MKFIGCWVLQQNLVNFGFRISMCHFQCFSFLNCCKMDEIGQFPGKKCAKMCKMCTFCKFRDTFFPGVFFCQKWPKIVKKPADAL